jgi:hypothetical protein
LITHRERTPQRRHAPIAEYALVIHRSARIADGAQIWRFGVTGAESPMHQQGGGRRFSRGRRLAMVSV